MRYTGPAIAWILAVYCDRSGSHSMKNLLCVVGLVAGGLAVPGAQRAPIALPKAPPTVDQILSLKRAGSPEISPDGRFVAYTVRETNWDDNAYETQIWVAHPPKGPKRKVTK